MSLPEPEPAALAASRQLEQRIAARIAENGGWLDFAAYMQMVLYEPGLGYYSAGSVKFGPGGDFVTSPELCPLFGETLARQLAQVLRLFDGDVLEAGAGSGALACQVLRGLAELESLPRRYCILEVSDDLRERQRARIHSEIPQWADRVVWLDRLPERFEGCILANELLDALPVNVLHWTSSGVRERGVAVESGRLVWRDDGLPAGDLLSQATALDVPQDYVSEIGLQAQGWVATLGGMLQRGLMLLIDYGFGEREFYHPQRERGTLMCHYRQQAHDDPFFLPGLQDLTAHIDFTAMAQAGIGAGLTLAGYATQAQFLLNCGLLSLLERKNPLDPSGYLPHVAAVQKLLSPAEMGELFKVMALARGIDLPLLGFLQGDQRRRL